MVIRPKVEMWTDKAGIVRSAFHDAYARFPMRIGPARLWGGVFSFLLETRVEGEREKCVARIRFLR